MSDQIGEGSHFSVDLLTGRLGIDFAHLPVIEFAVKGDTPWEILRRELGHNLR